MARSMSTGPLAVSVSDCHLWLLSNGTGEWPQGVSPGGYQRSRWPVMKAARSVNVLHCLFDNGVCLISSSPRNLMDSEHR